MNRRKFLAASGVGVAASLGGCLGGSSEMPGEQTETTTGSGTTTGGSGLTDSETVQYAATGMQPNWFEESGESVGDLVVIDSEDRGDAVLSPESLPAERREQVTGFLQNTDFEESVLLYVESVGPNACNDSIDVSDLAVEDGTLTGTARVVDSSEQGDGTEGDDGTEGQNTTEDGGENGTEDGGGMTACAQSITYPSAIVRATFSGEPVTQATFRIVDGWGNEAEVTASATDSLSPAATDLDGYVRPDGDPANVPASLTCDEEGVERQNWTGESEVPWGESGPLSDSDDDGPVFALRVDQREVALGETVEITMTNLTDETQYTGNRHKHGFEVLTEEGWQDVRVAPEDATIEYTDEGIGHDPGEGFQWTIELTEEGVVDGHAYEDTLEVCPDLQPGRYRFVFWEPAVAVAFDVTE